MRQVKYTVEDYGVVDESLFTPKLQQHTRNLSTAEWRASRSLQIPVVMKLQLGKHSRPSGSSQAWEELSGPTTSSGPELELVASKLAPRWGVDTWGRYARDLTDRRYP